MKLGLMALITLLFTTRHLKNLKKIYKDHLRYLKILTDSKIDKYRAPSYSINRKSLWALEILYKNGIKIDSSIFPSQNSRFGIHTAPTNPYFIRFNNHEKGLLEIPPTTFNLLGRRFPLSSGLFFRLNPLWLIKNRFHENSIQGVHSMIILHNWEMDVSQPKLKAGLRAYFIHYYHLNKTESKLKNLLSFFPFSPISQINSTETSISFNNFKK
jgi:hypothetical protein